MYWTTYARETVCLSQIQEHAVFKDDELLPLVPAARRGYQRRHRYRQPPGATATASRWAIGAGHSHPLSALSLPRPPPHPPGATAANNSNDRARIDTVSALMQST
jgi:hypothetical protein